MGEDCGSCAFHFIRSAQACHMKVREPVCVIDSAEGVVREPHEDACDGYIPKEERQKIEKGQMEVDYSNSKEIYPPSISELRTFFHWQIDSLMDKWERGELEDVTISISPRMTSEYQFVLEFAAVIHYKIPDLGIPDEI